MQTSTPEPHPKNSRAMTDEADIGSGEKSPGQADTDKIIQDIPPLEGGGKDAGGDVERPGQARSGKEAEADAATASENDRAGHGQVQREENRSRQDADPGMTPDAAVWMAKRP
jgi:hypothetical protein